jgi:uncharacterized repeat protein (TIGR01451 family)
MKTGFMKIRGAALKVLAGSLALLSVIAFVLPQTAQASTAYLTVIRNTATVNYNDTAGSAMPSQSSTVDITVAYQCAAPVLNAPADTSTQPGTAANYSTYTLTSNSNGPDVYNLTAPTITESAGISGSTVTFWQGATQITSITLGATTVAAGTTIAASGTTAISVPNDGASNSSINGIATGDTIVIGTAEYAVASITDNGGTVGTTSTITVNGNGTAQAITAGTLINERQTFTTRVTPGTVTAASNQTITVTISVVGTTACGTDTDETVTTVNVATLAILKEVSDDGSTWYTTAGAPQFLPGATVYYRITVTNNGSSNAQAVTVTDPVPAYTTYTSSTTLLNGIAVNGDGATSPLIAGLLVDDNGSRSSGAVATGILPPYTTGPAGQAIVIYRVTVN